ncbi:CYP704B1 [Symbiodinium microadriaticum]|nr:CYP704B1 [Symbiodinium microadriaticum]
MFINMLIEKPVLTVGSVLAAYVIWHVLRHLTTGHPKLLKEDYPFQNTIEVFQNRERILDYLWEREKEISGEDSAVINLFTMPWLIFTNRIDNITYILKNVDTFGKGPEWTSRFDKLLGNGIFNADGPVWHKHRKTSAHLFKLNTFKHEMIDAFDAHCNELVQVIKMKDGKPFDIQDLFMKFTLESIGMIAFGVKLGALQKDRVDFADCFDYCQAMTNEAFMDPFWVLKRLFTPAGWAFFYKIHKINSFAYALVRRRRKEIADRTSSSAPPSNYRDILSLYIEKHDPADGEISDTELRDVVLNFLIAGRDTTANALSWAVHRLCIHPEEQEKVYEEVHLIAQANHANSDRLEDPLLDYNDMMSAKYLEAFCMEVLRLHPSVPKEGKFAFKDTELPDGTKVKRGGPLLFRGAWAYLSFCFIALISSMYPLPGQLCVFSPWTMGRNESLWKNCMEFRPQRFLDDPKPSPFVFTAFQAGPRMCLGQNLALLEMKYALSRLLLQFELKLEQDPSSVTYMSTLTLPIKDGLKVSTSPRMHTK